METILKIEEISFKKHESDGHYDTYGGYQITTDKQTIKLGISEWGQCCENFGYFMSQDEFSQFVGASLIDIKIVDAALNVEKLDNMKMSYPDLMFVNINTSNGLLQFVAYNEHNGYYSHSAVVLSEQLNHEEKL